ncbi:uncharacterized protein UV8b_05313 [Ustilaginoidea virens]|uniref:Uncharacterized protein n=1 Tax=Ustilaginoidea virens TaxID=1159556 RepID=A0A8E5HSZ1_USTVR|nr:uncharacterized protein UV8b_05313 [Ustilaginoidea virens]QUC21070.1 hypothetical protein UV8b_05313 [Ustilaginoidea virens]
MPDCTIALPHFSIKDKAEKTTLTVTGQLVLDIPEAYGRPASVDELDAIIRETNLWITRNGLCYFRIEPSANGTPVIDVYATRYIRDVILGCKVWDDLGLTLLADDGPDEILANRISLSIQHPDLSSALTAPETAAVAAFRSVSYSIELSADCRAHCPKRDRARPTRKIEHLALEDRIAVEEFTQNMREQLVPADRQAVDEFMRSINFDPRSKPCCRTSNQPQRECLTTCDVLFTTSVKGLIDSCLNNILLGTRRHPQNLRVINSKHFVPLSRLAPGVFNMTYLKDISSKRSLVSIIAASLARMKDAESPSLRRKMDKFTSMNAYDETFRREGIQTDVINRGIEGSLWDMLLSESSRSRWKKKGWL